MFIDLAGQSGGGSKSIPIEHSIPSTGIVPNVHYALGRITQDPGIDTINPPEDENIDCEYFISFDIVGSVPTTITLPIKVIFADTPTWEVDKHYEISIKPGDEAYYGLVQSWPLSL